MRKAIVVALCLHLMVAGSMAGGFEQCGGTTNCKDHSPCADAKWTDVACVPGYACGRQNEFYWQCTNDPAVVKAAGASVAPASPEAPAAAAAPADAPAAATPVVTETVTGPIVPEAVADAGAPTAAAAAGPAAGGAGRSAGVLKSTGARDETAPEAQACACMDSGLNDPACFKGVTDYCETAEPPANMTVCESMSAFFNKQSLTAAKVVSEFFLRTCKLELPKNPSACACLEGLNTDGCKAATLHACSIGNTMCPAIAFGADGGPSSQEGFDRFTEQNCGGALVAAEVGMNFTGIGEADFLEKYAKGTMAALASITKQPVSSVTALPTMEILSGSLRGAYGSYSARKLMQANLKPVKKVLTKYQIRGTSRDAPMIKQRLEVAASNGAEGLYKALYANGVPLKPSFGLAGGPVVNGVAPRPGSGSSGAGSGGRGGGGDSGLDAGSIAGIVIGSVAALALIATVLILFVFLRNRPPPGAKPAAAAAAAPEAAAEAGGVKPAALDAAVKKAAPTKAVDINSNSTATAAPATPAAEASAAGTIPAVSSASSKSKKEQAAEAKAAKEAAAKAAADAAEAARKTVAEAQAAAERAAAEAAAAAAEAAAAADAAAAEEAEDSEAAATASAPPAAGAAQATPKRKPMFSLSASGWTTHSPTP